MYGIFKVTAELKKRPEAAWDIVEADTDVKFIKAYEKLDEAEEALKAYSTTIDKNSYVTTVYSCEAYFVAEAELVDEDDSYTEKNVLAGDGYAVTPLE